MRTFSKGLPFLMLYVAVGLSSCSPTDIEDINEDDSSRISRVATSNRGTITKDSSVTKDNAIVFSTQEEYDNFVRNLDSQLADNQQIMVQPVRSTNLASRGCGDGVYRGSGLSSGFATLTFDVSVTNGCISGIAGGFTGWTLGASYTQGGTQFGCNSGTVCGTVNYNLFFEGVGTVYSYRICYRISLNC